MCNAYTPTSATVLSRQFGINAQAGYRESSVFPRGVGAFIRRHIHSAGYERELVLAKWGLIPWFSKSSTLSYSTNNARFEELERKASYKQPWQKGQRCLIPVDHFWEPCWESGKNVWWRFRRIDGQALALAGLWNTWVDKGSGEVVESYTMLTINADGHSLFGRMHKPDPRLSLEAQDKRMVVVVDDHNWDAWLDGPPELARTLVSRAPTSLFGCGPDSEFGRR